MVRVGPYRLTETLGIGAFGKVKLGVHATTGEQVAVKLMDKKDILENEFTLQVRREIAIMKALKHRNIVELKEVLTSNSKIYVVLEYVRGGELYDVLEKSGRMDEHASRRYFHQLIDGVDYCHRRGISHRDLKFENLLLGTDGSLKVTDFGLSAMKGEAQLLFTQCGTLEYCAPEIITSAESGYDGTKVDSWACGIILFALLAGYLPFTADDASSLCRRILRGDFAFPPWFSEPVIDILKCLLVPNPKKRYSMAQIKEHSWFRVDYVDHEAIKKARKIERKNGRKSKRLSAVDQEKHAGHSTSSVTIDETPTLTPSEALARQSDQMRASAEALLSTEPTTPPEPKISLPAEYVAAQNASAAVALAAAAATTAATTAAVVATSTTSREHGPSSEPEDSCTSTRSQEADEVGSVDVAGTVLSLEESRTDSVSEYVQFHPPEHYQCAPMFVEATMSEEKMMSDMSATNLPETDVDSQLAVDSSSCEPNSEGMTDIRDLPDTPKEIPRLPTEPVEPAVGTEIAPAESQDSQSKVESGSKIMSTNEVEGDLSSGPRNHVIGIDIGETDCRASGSPAEREKDFNLLVKEEEGDKGTSGLVVSGSELQLDLPEVAGLKPPSHQPASGPVKLDMTTYQQPLPVAPDSTSLPSTGVAETPSFVSSSTSTPSVLEALAKIEATPRTNTREIDGETIPPLSKDGPGPNPEEISAIPPSDKTDFVTPQTNALHAAKDLEGTEPDNVEGPPMSCPEPRNTKTDSLGRTDPESGAGGDVEYYVESEFVSFTDQEIAEILASDQDGVHEMTQREEDEHYAKSMGVPSVGLLDARRIGRTGASNSAGAVGSAGASSVVGEIETVFEKVEDEPVKGDESDTDLVPSSDATKGVGGKSLKYGSEEVGASTRALTQRTPASTTGGRNSRGSLDHSLVVEPTGNWFVSRLTNWFGATKRERGSVAPEAPRHLEDSDQTASAEDTIASEDDEMISVADAHSQVHTVVTDWESRNQHFRDSDRHAAASPKDEAKVAGNVKDLLGVWEALLREGRGGEAIVHREDLTKFHNLMAIFEERSSSPELFQGAASPEDPAGGGSGFFGKVKSMNLSRGNSGPAVSRSSSGHMVSRGSSGASNSRGSSGPVVSRGNSGAKAAKKGSFMSSLLSRDTSPRELNQKRGSGVIETFQNENSRRSVDGVPDLSPRASHSRRSLEITPTVASPGKQVNSTGAPRKNQSHAIHSRLFLDRPAAPVASTLQGKDRDVANETTVDDENLKNMNSVELVVGRGLDSRFDSLRGFVPDENNASDLNADRVNSLWREGLNNPNSAPSTVGATPTERSSYPEPPSESDTNQLPTPDVSVKNTPHSTNSRDVTFDENVTSAKGSVLSTQWGAVQAHGLDASASYRKMSAPMADTKKSSRLFADTGFSTSGRLGRASMENRRSMLLNVSGRVRPKGDQVEIKDKLNRMFRKKRPDEKTTQFNSPFDVEQTLSIVGQILLDQGGAVFMKRNKRKMKVVIPLRADLVDSESSELHADVYLDPIQADTTLVCFLRTRQDKTSPRAFLSCYNEIHLRFLKDVSREDSDFEPNLAE